MQREQIIAALVAAGLTQPTEDQIAKAMAVVTTDGDSDKLNKAMTGLRDAFNREHTAENDRLAKAMEQSADVVEAITAGCDAVIGEQQTQNEALAKGMTALIDESRLFRTELRSMGEQLSVLVTENADLRKAMDAPKAPKAVTATVIPSPADDSEAAAAEVAAPSVPDLINKAMGLQRELAKTDGDHSARQNQLADAIMQLNSGYAPGEVATRYGLTA